MIYLDSSALVKRYIEEKGSDRVNSLLKETTIAVTSRISYPEILSAITHRHKAGDISSSGFEGIKKEFKTEWDFLTVIEMRVEVLEFIDRIIDKHALRGADSIHLSTALWLKNSMKEDVLFVASNTELLKSAKLEKLKVLNPAN